MAEEVRVMEQRDKCNKKDVGGGIQGLFLSLELGKLKSCQS